MNTIPHRLLALVLVSLILATATGPARAALLFGDNFNAADTTNFDGALLTGRLSGSLAGDVVPRSWGRQMHISGGQLLAPAGGGQAGIRFHDIGGPFGANNRYDWASGPTGAEILGAGGFFVTFDYIPPAATGSNWVSWQVGTANADSGVNAGTTDYGILFRQGGGTERWQAGSNLGAGGSFTSSGGALPHNVRIRFDFDSFADGTPVLATSWVDGVQVASDMFTWNNNNGELRMELGSTGAGHRIDNLMISSIPEPTRAALLGLAGIGLLLKRRR